MPDDSRIPARAADSAHADPNVALAPLVGELQAAVRMRARGWITSHNVQFHDRDRERPAAVPLVADFLAPGSGEDEDEPVYVYAGLSVAVIRPPEGGAVTVLTTERDDIDDVAAPPLAFANLSPGDLSEDEMRAAYPGFGLGSVARRSVLSGAADPAGASRHRRSGSIDRTLSMLAAAANEQHAGVVEAEGTFSGDDPEIGFYSGLVVVDGPLLGLNVAMDGAGSPLPVEHAHLRYRQAATKYAPEPGARDHLIDFVTLSYLETWLENYEAWLEGLLETLIGNLISDE